ncbi:anhydro-N-acetylmuramic acid kinase [Thiohalospira halophila DSM 15071]|uniref:Anhydro-N-acetylmuramic acid kinase n=1 Tax=Thiohalospira halophila DSM 15071 TaxID=1123397 RepID=A0A1I1UTQ0_9GAMM|nr:anhydro-N-acetylmuramic acid kinase [Thiohalospira halophila]SFD74181.1 anhydro-N-acetylmuramic acid kinase [Thiohalospira halophila DSM 15071]
MGADAYIGLMSGTSHDGIDAAVVTFDPAPNVITANTRPYSTDLADRLLSVTNEPRQAIDEVLGLDAQLGEAFGEAALAAITEAGIARQAIRAIGCHGHTLHHAPSGPHGNSWALGDPNWIAEATGLPVVADFRRRDIAAGGQGAPLAPAFHAFALGHPRENRAVVNLGGIANITLLPPAGPVSGFDTGPANTLLDSWVREHRGTPYDTDGTMAAAGTVIPELLESLRADPYFQRPSPKSTGREHFSREWLERFQPGRWRAVDVAATLAALTTTTVADALRPAGPERVLVCGGGVHNPVLMAGLREALPGTTVEGTRRHGLDPDMVEAAAFAWLARERLAGRPANEPAVTGARERVVLGGLYSP